MKRSTKLTFDQYVGAGVRDALRRANSATATALEEKRKWEHNWDRQQAAKARLKAKTAASQTWRTRWLNSAKKSKARIMNRPSAQHLRYAWPQFADQVLVSPETHKSNVGDCVHVRIFDSRGVPVVRMSLTGTADFIKGVVMRVSEEISRHERKGSLDRPNVTLWDESNGLPVAARLS